MKVRLNQLKNVALALLLASSLPALAQSMDLGYRSESAFSFAFKREMGCSPRHYSHTLAG